MIRIAFIGAGTVGTALAVRLKEKGYSIVAVASGSLKSAQNLAKMVFGCRVYADKQAAVDDAELIFITTPDDAIPKVVAELKWRPGQMVVHCSGADSVDVLEPARKSGALVGTFHPLQTFANVTRAIENMSGSTFALEGDPKLLPILRQMATDLEGHWIELKPGDKVLYHAAAVMACNYFVTLVKLSTDLWQTFGVSSEQATQALVPLLQGTVNNLEKIGLPNCLTGPVARGDIGTISKHIAALKKAAPAALPVYRQLTLETIPIALAKGRLSPERAEQIRKLVAEQ